MLRPTRTPPVGAASCPDGRATCQCSPLGPACWVNGVRIDPLGRDQTLDRLDAYLRCPATHVINHIPAHPTVLARRDPVLRDALNAADLNVADGIGVVWACRLQGHGGLRERVYGPDFLLDVCSWDQGRRLTHAFVGATPRALGLLESNLRLRFPAIRIVGTYSPPFRSIDHRAVAEDIGRLGHADILWVGLGTPKQQVWAGLARAYAPARAIVTVGAAFDFIAGTKRQAPPWLRDAGFEWAFRLVTEPRRLWKRALVDNAEFAWSVAWDLRNPQRGPTSGHGGARLR